MRTLIKTANKFDTVWTMVVMFPAFALFFNIALALHQGNATPTELAGAANEIAVKFSAQYMPYIETTSGALMSGIERLSAAAASCVGGSKPGPVYTNPALIRSQGCSFGNSFKSSSVSIKPYRAYH